MINTINFFRYSFFQCVEYSYLAVRTRCCGCNLGVLPNQAGKMNKSCYINTCCSISGVSTLTLLLFYCNVLPGAWITDFSTNSSDMRTFLSTSPAPAGKMNSIKQNVSALSYRESRLQNDQQLRDAIRFHHDRNFIQPKNETCTKRFPSCIIIGVFKCGTRELLDFLNLHPHIESYPSTLKGYEMTYFNSKYRLGDKWLQSQMPCTYSNQITLMKNAGYFHDSAVPARIKKFNKNIKIILMVRDPVSRSRSHYTFCKYMHQELPKNSNYMKCAKTSFSSFVLNSNSGVAETNYFVSNSVYDKPMKLWLKYFNLSQFLILDNEELKRDPVSALNKVERFLGLEHFITDKMFVLNKDKGFYCVQSSITDTGMACYSESRGHQEQNEVPDKTLSKLRDYFKIKNQQFFEMIGRSFDWK